MDPRTKIISLAVLSIIIFSTNKFLVIFGLFILFIALWKLCKLQFKILAKYFTFLIKIVAFIVLTQSFFYKSRLSLEGFYFGLLVGFRLITLTVLMPLVTLTTKTNILALGLIKLGLNYKIAYTATASLNFVQTFTEEIGYIMEAQKLRGITQKGTFIKKLKVYKLIAIPLVIGAMCRAKSVGVAMDTRAFGAFKTRTSIDSIKMTSIDYFTLAVVFIFSILVFIFR